MTISHSNMDIFSSLVQSLVSEPDTQIAKPIIRPKYLLAFTKLSRITNKELAEFLGVTKPNAWKITRKCVKYGILEGSKTTARKIPVVYTITQYGRTYISQHLGGLLNE